ncbi:unnamed protein product [Prorocentrum cordatum]|uniref:Anaphase-promoting complex subunit 1 n=1 Tax=Prorocentrum cordatum TaxID=2364126 RepID=A0ABN9U9A6_9DINO|nr:unnamed protein product [Polarella glacialis]
MPTERCSSSQVLMLCRRVGLPLDAAAAAAAAAWSPEAVAGVLMNIPEPARTDETDYYCVPSDADSSSSRVLMVCRRFGFAAGCSSSLELRSRYNLLTGIAELAMSDESV